MIEIAGGIAFALITIAVVVTLFRANKRYQRDVGLKASQMLDQHLAATGGTAVNHNVIRIGAMSHDDTDNRAGADDDHHSGGYDDHDLAAYYGARTDDDVRYLRSIRVSLRAAIDARDDDRVCELLRPIARTFRIIGTDGNPDRVSGGSPDGAVDLRVLEARSQELRLPGRGGGAA